MWMCLWVRLVSSAYVYKCLVLICKIVSAATVRKKIRERSLRGRHVPRKERAVPRRGIRGNRKNTCSKFGKSTWKGKKGSSYYPNLKEMTRWHCGNSSRLGQNIKSDRKHLLRGDFPPPRLRRINPYQNQEVAAFPVPDGTRTRKREILSVNLLNS